MAGAIVYIRVDWPVILPRVLPPSVSTPAERDVHAARRGDRAAFGRLFERYASMVHGVLLARVQSSDADDLMQEVFITAMERIENLDSAQAFGPWLAAIARNRAMDSLRSRRRFEELPPSLAVIDPRRAEANQVLRLIQSLPEAYREPLVLRLAEGMSGPEIAQQVGMTADSVRVNLHRGMKLLREKMGRSGGEEEAT
jgi:RNA polymerase sigma-70 factor, ECF subfamily